MQHLRSTRPRARAAAALAAALALAWPRGSDAAACCMSATSFGIGRLLVWEDWAAGVQLGYARSLGQWDASGSLRWNGADFSDAISQVEPWAIVRLAPRLEVQAWVPILVNTRSSQVDSQIAGGLGDVGAAVRFEAVSIGEYAGLPSLAITAAVLAPTGRRVEQTSPPLFAGTTGRGAWGGSLALSAEYAFLPWFVRLDGGVTGYLPFDRPDTGEVQQFAPLVQAALSGGLEVAPDTLVLALAVMGEWEGAVRVGGAPAPGSSAFLYSLAASASWRVDPHWTLTGTVVNTVWPDGGGENRDARLGLTLGVRHGHF